MERLTMMLSTMDTGPGGLGTWYYAKTAFVIRGIVNVPGLCCCTCAYGLDLGRSL